jgi:hypothetical protein
MKPVTCRIIHVLALSVLSACTIAVEDLQSERAGGRDEPRHPPGCESACASPDGPTSTSGGGMR